MHMPFAVRPAALWITVYKAAEVYSSVYTSAQVRVLTWVEHSGDAVRDEYHNTAKRASACR